MRKCYQFKIQAQKQFGLHSNFLSNSLSLSKNLNINQQHPNPGKSSPSKIPTEITRNTFNFSKQLVPTVVQHAVEWFRKSLGTKGKFPVVITERLSR